MATNTKQGSRVGAVRQRTQFEHNGRHYKCGQNGRIMACKADAKPWKGIRRRK